MDGCLIDTNSKLLRTSKKFGLDVEDSLEKQISHILFISPRGRSRGRKLFKIK